MLCINQITILHILCSTKNVMIEGEKNTLMRKVFILFPSAHIIVGAGLFLILFLFCFTGRFLFRFAFRINNAFHCFTDRQFIQYAKARRYGFH